MIRKSLAATVLAVMAAGAVLAGCGSDAGGAGAASSPGGQTAAAGSPSTQQQADHNEADMSFAKQMIPHHAGAVEMAKMVEGRTNNAAVVALAKRVQDAQAPEIQQMTDWVTKWGAMPEMTSGQSMPGMSGHAMPEGGHAMPGDMSADDMTKLGKAKGAAFDRMWLEMMIKHHQGALDMARTAVSQGSNPDVKSLAQKIIDGQQAEITEMQGILGKQ